MSDGRHSITEFYCHLVCPYLGQQLLDFEAASKEELPKRMCPAMAGVAIESLAESIVERAPDSAVQHAIATDNGEGYMQAVLDSAREYRNLAGACARMLIREGTRTFDTKGAPDLRVIEDKDVYKKLAQCADPERLDS
jgi:hypothetical protein